MNAQYRYSLLQGLIAALLCAWPFFAGAAPITNISIETSEGKTTAIIETIGDDPYKVISLDSPPRLAVDIQNSRWATTTPNSLNQGLVTKIRHGIQNKQDLRIVFDLSKKPLKYQHSRNNGLTVIEMFTKKLRPLPYKTEKPIAVKPTLESPKNDKIQPLQPPPSSQEPIKLEEPKNPELADPTPSLPAPYTLKKPATSNKGALAPPPVLLPPSSKPSSGVIYPKPPASYFAKYGKFIPVPVFKSTAPDYKPMIVIDPGHGGHDPGALGRSNIVEKVLTLNYALAFEQALLKTGKYRVTLTRKSDKFVKLQDRVKKAQDAQADLFVSLHADSHKNARLKGLSVYTLSEVASDKEAEALADSTNKSGILPSLELEEEDKEVTDMLLDLAQRGSKNMSSTFAEYLTEELGKETTLLRNTHRFAGFKVLKSPDIPSILVELGYLSNRVEEELLRSPQYKEKIMSAFLRAIDRYYTTYPPSAVTKVTSDEQ